MLSLADFKQWYQNHSQEILRDFFKFLSFKSISADPACAQEIRATANWLSDYLKRIGLDSEVHETSGHPVVYATHLKAGKSRPTLLIYQHYDVQPVDPLNLWHSNPFEPVLKNNTVFARGAVDNKGQCFYSICAIRAFLELAKTLNFNLKLFIEGEEESNSNGTTSFLAQKKIDLSADQLLVIDFDLPKAQTPGITLGMRGIAAFSVTCVNSHTDLHSGVHGGIALNPNRALATLLARLWDEKGKVLAPDFYEGIKPLSKEERAKIDFTFDREEYMHKFGVKAFGMEDDFSPLEANWLRPTLEINGLTGGYSGPGVKTVIPARAEAKISCRLVEGQDPEKVVKGILNFLQAQAPKDLTLQTELFASARAFRASPDSAVVKIAAKALEEVFGKPCKFQLCGASVPIVPALVAASGAEAALFGMGLDDDAIHAPNEHFGMDRFEQGFLTLTRILSHLRDCK